MTLSVAAPGDTSLSDATARSVRTPHVWFAVYSLE